MIVLITLITVLCSLNASATSEQIQQSMNEPIPSQFAAKVLKGSFNTQGRDVIQHQTHFTPHQESRTTAFQKSFIKYVKNIYNKANYALALSQDGSHIIQFWDICNEMNLKADAVYNGMKLFNNKFKDCEIVEDSVIQTILGEMPDALERYFSNDDVLDDEYDLDFVKKQQQEIIISQLTAHIPTLHIEPEAFVYDLVQMLSNYHHHTLTELNKQHQKIEARTRLSTIIIRFLETIIGKTIWNVSDYQTIWQSFIDISQGLMMLGSYGIITHMDDLDDMLWTLVIRFCFFLDLTGALLPQVFYDQIKQDLDNQVVFFLEYEEQDQGITTKKEKLIDSLISAHAKLIAYQQSGIMTDLINV